MLLELLGIDVPIVQAPMAGVSTPAMAAAVSNAGALGSIGVGSTHAAGAREMIAAVAPALPSLAQRERLLPPTGEGRRRRRGRVDRAAAAGVRALRGHPAERPRGDLQELPRRRRDAGRPPGREAEGGELPFRHARARAHPGAAAGGDRPPRFGDQRARGATPRGGGRGGRGRAGLRGGRASGRLRSRCDRRPPGNDGPHSSPRSRGARSGDRRRRNHGRRGHRRRTAPRRERGPARHGLRDVRRVAGRRRLPGRLAERRREPHRDDARDLGSTGAVPGESVHRARRRASRPATFPRIRSPTTWERRSTPRGRRRATPGSVRSGRARARRSRARCPRPISWRRSCPRWQEPDGLRSPTFHTPALSASPKRVPLPAANDDLRSFPVRSPHPHPARGRRRGCLQGPSCGRLRRRGSRGGRSPGGFGSPRPRRRGRAARRCDEDRERPREQGPHAGHGHRSPQPERHGEGELHGLDDRREDVRQLGGAAAAGAQGRSRSPCRSGA